MEPLDAIQDDGYRVRNRRLYRLDETGFDRLYVSDAMRNEAKKINAEKAWMANDKSMLDEILGPYGSYAVRTYGVVTDGQYISLGYTDAEVKDLLAEGGRVVVKPRWGSDGYGVRVYTTPGDFTSIMCLDEHVVTEYVRQASYASRIWPSSTNTIRIFTMHLPDEPNFIAAAIHRFGTTRSGNTDNWEQGGMSVRIHNGGRLDLGAITYGNGPIWFHRHPDTGQKFLGMVVPGWPDIERLVLAMADHVYGLHHIGWDIVITDDGPVVLEMNANCGVCAIQVHGGLLSDARIRAFYAAHDVGMPS